MQDRQLYQQILGIASPWFVSRVELGLEAGEVHVYLEHKKTASWCCPECEEVSAARSSTGAYLASPGKPAPIPIPPSSTPG